MQDEMNDLQEVYTDPNPGDLVRVVRKPIKGYEGYYKVDQFGRVFSDDRVIHVFDNGREYDKFIPGKQMKQTMHSHGYKTVALTKDGNTKQMYVHRLVAQAFIDNPNNLPFINHKDEDKTNNFADNLEWCTNKYNVNYGKAKERRRKKIIGVPHTEEHKRKISESVKEYYKTHASKNIGRVSEKRKSVIGVWPDGEERKFASLHEAAATIGGRYENICAACHGRRKTAYGIVWRFDCSYGERKDG